MFQHVPSLVWEEVNVHKSICIEKCDMTAVMSIINSPSFLYGTICLSLKPPPPGIVFWTVP